MVLAPAFFACPSYVLQVDHLAVVLISVVKAAVKPCAAPAADMATQRGRLQRVVTISGESPDRWRTDPVCESTCPEGCWATVTRVASVYIVSMIYCIMTMCLPSVIEVRLSGSPICNK